MSAQFSLDKADAIHIGKVIGYSLVSTLIGGLIMGISDLHVPDQIVYVIPIVNALLVSIQKFVEDRPVA